MKTAKTSSYSKHFFQLNTQSIFINAQSFVLLSIIALKKKVRVTMYISVIHFVLSLFYIFNATETFTSCLLLNKLVNKPCMCIVCVFMYVCFSTQKLCLQLFASNIFVNVSQGLIRFVIYFRLISEVLPFNQYNISFIL